MTDQATVTTLRAEWDALKHTRYPAIHQTTLQFVERLFAALDSGAMRYPEMVEAMRARHLWAHRDFYREELSPAQWIEHHAIAVLGDLGQMLDWAALEAGSPEPNRCRNCGFVYLGKVSIEKSKSDWFEALNESVKNTLGRIYQDGYNCGFEDKIKAKQNISTASAMRCPGYRGNCDICSRCGKREIEHG